MTAPHLSDASKASLDAFLHDTLASGAYPAITLGAIGTTGDPFYLSCAGDRVYGEPDKGPVTSETCASPPAPLTAGFALHSMTKLVTSVAVLQLVDAGKVDLDSPAVLAAYCPELAALAVLTAIEGGRPVFVPRSAPLTVRHLLTHTSGLSYTFTSGLVARYNALTGSLGHWAGTLEGYCAPLVFQPGDKWKYSTGLEWAGFLVERVSGMRLDTYFSKHIFGPLGIDHALSFFPTPEVLAKLQVLCKRDGGKLVHSAGTRPLDAERVRAAPLRGGGGLFGTAEGYLRFLQGLLAKAIVSEASFDELFTDSLSPAVAAQMGRDVAAILGDEAGEDAQKVGQSVGCMIFKSDSRFGPKAGSGAWGGMANTQYWLDPAMGIAVGLEAGKTD
jgi:methyl acetate hydrolase